MTKLLNSMYVDVVTLHIFVLSFSDDLEVLTAALSKLEEKSFVETLQEEDGSFVQTLQEEDKMAPAQFQDEIFDYDAELRDSEPMTTIKPDEIGEAIGGEIGEAIGGAIEIVVDNTQNTIEILQGLLASIGDLVPQIPGIPAQALDMLCVAVWWPLQETHCKETRYLLFMYI